MKCLLAANKLAGIQQIAFSLFFGKQGFRVTACKIPEYKEKKFYSGWRPVGCDVFDRYLEPGSAKVFWDERRVKSFRFSEHGNRREVFFSGKRAVRFAQAGTRPVFEFPDRVEAVLAQVSLFDEWKQPSAFREVKFFLPLFNFFSWPVSRPDCP